MGSWHQSEVTGGGAAGQTSPHCVNLHRASKEEDLHGGGFRIFSIFPEIRPHSLLSSPHPGQKIRGSLVELSQNLSP